MNKTDAELKTNWNQMQTGGDWIHLTFMGVVHNDNVRWSRQGKYRRWVKTKMKQQVGRMKMKQQRVGRTNGFVLGFFS
jgi:hypothetical protein